MKFHFKRISILLGEFILLFFTVGDIFSQESKDIEKKKQDNILQLKYSKNLLEKTAQSKNLTLNQLNLIQHNIELRSTVVDNISDELSILKNDIEANNIEIKKAENKIDIIKRDYAKLIIGMSRNFDNDYAMMYIFSSQDLNKAYQRIKYLKYLTRYRRDLVDKLKNEEADLQQRNFELFTNKKRKERLLIERKSELLVLDIDKKQNISLIRALKNKEADLKKDIQKRERIQAEIENEIRRIIEEEAAKARSAKRKNVLSEEEKIISTDFYKTRGRLPWPAEQGIIIGKYGEQNHPVLKGIKIRSNGIDINTVEGAKVRSVFDGEVTKVIAILGANFTVIIKHGDFRTVYQNLIDIRVKAGDKVKTKTIIGIVFTDQDNISRFHFEVWKDKVIQNPEIWLSK